MDVDVTLHDAENKGRGSVCFIISGMRLDKHSNATETFGANSDAVSVKKVVSLLRAEDANSVRHVLTHPKKHGRATREHDIGVETSQAGTRCV